MRLFVLAALLLGCGDNRHEGVDAAIYDVGFEDGGDVDAGESDAGPERSSFTWLYTERLSKDMYCASAGCHDTQTAGGGQSFASGKASAYAALMGDTVNSLGAPAWPKKVVPGDPESSFLWIKLTRDDAPLGRMPLARPPLGADDLQSIREWIDAGALND